MRVGHATTNCLRGCRCVCVYGMCACVCVGGCVCGTCNSTNCLPGCIWHSVQPPVCMCVCVGVGVSMCVCVCVYVWVYTMYINKLL